jgi:hypothetical protein
MVAIGRHGRAHPQGDAHLMSIDRVSRSPRADGNRVGVAPCKSQMYTACLRLRRSRDRPTHDFERCATNAHDARRVDEGRLE